MEALIVWSRAREERKRIGRTIENKTMDVRKLRIPSTLSTQDISDIAEPTGNVYASLNIVGQRAEQIALQVRDELNEKIQDFLMPSNTLDEVFENPEQIEISKYYERIPKAHLIALDEFLKKELFYRFRAEEEPTDEVELKHE